MPLQNSKIRTYIHEQRGNFENMLGQMVEIPSVSSDPDHTSDMQKMAELAVDYLKEFGARSTIIKTKGHPSVVGEWWVGRPAISVSNHLQSLGCSARSGT